MPDPVDAYDEPETSGPARLDPGDRVFEYRRARRHHAERAGTGQKGVRRRLTRQVLAFGDNTVDPDR